MSVRPHHLSQPSRTTAFLLTLCLAGPALPCCPAPPRNKPVLNADQTVLIIWDASTKTQHFIRQASFTSAADDFGFLIPTPNLPEVEESGDGVFPYLSELTAPEKKKRNAGPGCHFGCSSKFTKAAAGNKEEVRVLKRVPDVAGFSAVVLEADSATALVGWFERNGYAFSPEVKAWAQPYVDGGWKITALKVLKKDPQEQTVNAKALRLSFRTERPVFPYREPDYKNALSALEAKQRLLRIFFIGEARYKGTLTEESPWTATVAWSDRVADADRSALLKLLGLPESTGPKDWWLTEFEDHWQYKLMPADVYFEVAAIQQPKRRDPQYVYDPFSVLKDPIAYAFAVMLLGPQIIRRVRPRSGSQ